VTEAGIDALIVDLDGVIRHWDNEHFVETAASFGLRGDELAAIAFEKELLDAGMTGALTFEAWADEIGRRIESQHPQYVPHHHRLMPMLRQIQHRAHP